MDKEQGLSILNSERYLDYCDNTLLSIVKERGKVGISLPDLLPLMRNNVKKFGTSYRDNFSQNDVRVIVDHLVLKGLLEFKDNKVLSTEFQDKY